MKLRCCSLLKGVIYLQQGNERRALLCRKRPFYIAHGFIMYEHSSDEDGFTYERACTNPDPHLKIVLPLGLPAGVHRDNSIISQNTVHTVAARKIYRGQAHMHSVEETLKSGLGEMLVQVAR